jgi:hypothetical protein
MNHASAIPSSCRSQTSPCGAQTQSRTGAGLFLILQIRPVVQTPQASEQQPSRMGICTHVVVKSCTAFATACT